MKAQSIIISFLAVFVAVFLSGCTVIKGESSAQTYANDATTTAKVKANLTRSDIVPASQVTVNTDRGVVQLSGFVRNKDQADEAARIALNTEGVRSVKNDLITYKEARGKSLTDKAKRKVTYQTK